MAMTGNQKDVSLLVQGEVGEPGQKGAKGGKGEHVSNLNPPQIFIFQW